MEEQKTIEIEEEVLTETWGGYEALKADNIKKFFKLALEYADKGNENGAQAYIKAAQTEFDYLKQTTCQLLTDRILAKK